MSLHHVQNWVEPKRREGQHTHLGTRCETQQWSMGTDLVHGGEVIIQLEAVNQSEKSAVTETPSLPRALIQPDTQLSRPRLGTVPRKPL